MKKILIWLVPFFALTALSIYLFNGIENYNFMTQLKKVSQFEFPNPIDNFWDVIDAFKKWGELGWTSSEVISSGNAWNDFWQNDFWQNVGQWFVDTGNNLGGYFSLIFQILVAPVMFIYDLVMDVAFGAKAILTMLGIF